MTRGRSIEDAVRRMILHPEPDDPEPVEQVEHVMTYYETVSAAYWLARRVETLKQEIGNG